MSEPDSGFHAIVAELQRRRVVRVGLIYGAVAFAGLQGLDIVLPALGLPARVFNVLVAAVLVGFPLTLVISWLYDLTPRGWVRTGPAGTDGAASWIGGGGLAVLGSVVFSLLVGMQVTDGGTGEAEPGPPEQPAIERVAVLPFENLSTDPGNEYFADGLTDELRHAVGRIEGIRVAGRTSTFAFKNRDDEPRIVARELGVQALLAGSVRKDGDEVLISAELVDGRDGLSVWTRQYEDRVQDVFGVQADIAASIADALAMTLTDEAREAIAAPPTEHPMALDKVRWGRFNWNRRTAAGLEAAIANFREAISFDSTYAEAWAGLADAYILLPEYRGGDPEPSIRAGKDAAERALALDPDLAPAHASLGLIEMFDWEWAAAERSFRQSIRLDSTYATAHQWYANMLMGQRRWDEALEHIDRAEALDRGSTVIRQDAARILLNAGRVEEAIAKAQETIELNPTYAAIYLDLGYMFLTRDRFDDARNAFEVGSELLGSDELGFTEFADAVEAFRATGRRQPLPRRDRYADPSALLAGQLVWVGQTDEALDVLERAAEARTWDFITIGASPSFQALHGHPRYEALLDTLGVS